MTTDGNQDRALTRRAFTGLGIAAGAAAAIGFPEVPTAGATSVTPMASPPIEAFGSINPALTYMQIDAFAFETYDSGHFRYYTDSSGVQSTDSGFFIAAPIPIPCGSTIYQVNITYRSSSTCQIRLRDLANVVTPWFTFPFSQPLPASAGAAQVTYDLNPGITIGNRTSASFACFSSGGSALYGVTLGYTPPTQGFMPFSGTPRVLDTRLAGGGGPLLPNEERVIDLGFAGARGAVLNLTVTDTSAPGGYVAVFPANIAWPNNSSINWSGANQNIANGVTTALDPLGRIRIRGGATPTNVVIDRIGWLI